MRDTNRWNLKRWNEFANQEPLQEYNLIINDDEIILELPWVRVSLTDELEAYTWDKKSISFFKVKSKDSIEFEYWNKNKLENKSKEVQAKALEAMDVWSLDQVNDHIIYIPESATYQPLIINAVAHEIWHMICNKYGKNLIEHERNAHARWLRFIKHIENKYWIDTQALKSEISKLWLIQYQTKRYLHKYAPNILDQLDPNYKYKKSKLDQLDDSKPDRLFI